MHASCLKGPVHHRNRACLGSPAAHVGANDALVPLTPLQRWWQCRCASSAVLPWRSHRVPQMDISRSFTEWHGFAKTSVILICRNKVSVERQFSSSFTLAFLSTFALLCLNDLLFQYAFHYHSSPVHGHCSPVPLEKGCVGRAAVSSHCLSPSSTMNTTSNLTGCP